LSEEEEEGNNAEAAFQLVHNFLEDKDSLKSMMRNPEKVPAWRDLAIFIYAGDDARIDIGITCA